jgi:hypothetical protein
MALIIKFAPIGMTDKKYAEVMKRLDAAGASAPPGRLHHTCYGPRDSLRVADVFDTMESFEAFGRTLIPILTAVGVEVGKPDVEEVHNIVRG